MQGVMELNTFLGTGLNQYPNYTVYPNYYQWPYPTQMTQCPKCGYCPQCGQQKAVPGGLETK